MQKQTTAGWLLIAGALGVLVPYTILTSIFEYPEILRKDTGVVLTRFHDGGTKLIFTWLSFAITGLPLIPAYIGIGQALEHRSSLVRTATVIGVVGLVLQMIGLLRWVFVVPVLAETYVGSADIAARAAAVVAFETIHQFAGVILGEHLGQLFTIIWTVLISIAFARLKVLPRWVFIFGVSSSLIYFLAQAELLATVIPSFPVWGAAGFIGSTLWLVWLVIVGIRFLRGGNQIWM